MKILIKEKKQSSNLKFDFFLLKGWNLLDKLGHFKTFS